MKTIKTVNFKMKTIPSSDFIRTLAELTDNNEHGEVYKRIADWCIANCDAVAQEPNWFREIPKWQYCMNIFRMFREMFVAMETCHNANTDFPFGDLRYEVGKRMDETIESVFGKETLDALNEGR